MILSFYNAKTGKTEKIRAFLDTGAQLTVISAECAKRCGLEVQSVEKVLLSTFNNKMQKHDLNTTKLDFYENLEDFSGKLTVFPYIMDVLVEPITAYDLTKRQTNFLENNNLTLADEEAGKAGSLKVDMLLGQDCVYKFCKEKPIFLPGGSVLIPTWGNKHILAGPLDHESLCQRPQTFRSPECVMINVLNCSLESLKSIGMSRKYGSIWFKRCTLVCPVSMN